MELPLRTRNGVFLPDGSFGRARAALRAIDEAHDLRIGIVNAFDFRTRMLPYWYADKRMAVASVRTLADVLYACGFERIRVVLQQWTPRFRPSLATIDGRPLDLLLVSAMQVHAEPAYALIRDVHQMGDARPLVLAGGPKAIYEPTDYFEVGPSPGVGADCVVTGEAYVLVELLQAILENRAGNESVREAFERARRVGRLDAVPGLVYLEPGQPADRPVAVNTGVQRLVRDLDELPMPDAGYRLLEPPHRGTRLRCQPLAVSRVRRHSPIASVISTHGCKFNCDFCPIPSVNQRTWRHKSPERLAAEIKHIHEQFDLSAFFGTDDNFFNDRRTVISLMSGLARTTSRGGPLGQRIRLYTEATAFDVHRNADILPLCREGGLRGIWFGLEDLTAELVNKGQTAAKTEQLFARMCRLGIQPMAMVIHSDGQRVRCGGGDLSGLINQARYLRDCGAVSYQCTYLGPAVGTRSFEAAMESGTMFRRVGGRPIPQAFCDGNHVVASADERPWRRQLNVLRAYATFYNPYNTLRAIAALGRDAVSTKRVAFQLIGQLGLLMTIPKLVSWALRLKRGPVETWNERMPLRIPMVDSIHRRPMNWAIEHAAPAGGATVPHRPEAPRPRRTVHKHGSKASMPSLTIVRQGSPV